MKRLILFLVCLIVTVFPERASADDYSEDELESIEFSIIAHEELPIDDISRRELMNLFTVHITGKVQGVEVMPVNLKDPVLRSAFFSRLLPPSAGGNVKISIGDFKAVTLDNPEDVGMFIKERKNCIGWMPVSDVPKLSIEVLLKVKVLSVEGLHPRQPGYPLGPDADKTSDPQ